MVRKLLALTIVLVSMMAVVGLGAAPAGANANVTANFVSLNGVGNGGGDNCSSNADLEIGIDAVTVDTEFGLVTNLSGSIGGFGPNGSGFSGFNGLSSYGMPIDDAQIEGTIIGSYAWVGTEPTTAADTAEWFVLYRCSDTAGASDVLYDCFGDFGTCPQTAAEAVAEIFEGTVDDTTPDPGQAITATGLFCYYPLGGALLFRDGTSLGGASKEPGINGEFSVPFTVPADTPPGTELTVRFDCGFDGQTVLSVEVPLGVPGPLTVPTTGPPTTAPPAASASPRFTG